jgi:plasmid stabilization system protein ParE
VIVYSRDAERDVERLHDWLVEFGARSAEVFMTRLAIAERRVENHPLRYRRLRDGETRRYSFRLNRTAYLIDYRVDSDAVVVLRVWHGSQDRPE